MSRTTRLNKALTVALYSESGTMTIETQMTNEKEYDNISDTNKYIIEHAGHGLCSLVKYQDGIPENDHPPQY